MNAFTTVATTVAGEKRLRAIVMLLISESQFFAVTPLPDDLWRLEVKVENARLLSSLAEKTAGVKS